MFRIDADANVAGLFSEGNPAAGLPGTRVSADWLNAVQEEIVGLITTAAGLTLNKADNTQLHAAIDALIAAHASLTNPHPNLQFPAPTLLDLKPLLATGWSENPSTTPINYWKTREGLVRFRGQIWASGASGASGTLFTLPAGFRPTVSGYGAQMVAPVVIGSATMGVVTVTSGGVVMITNPGTQACSVFLDGISFLAQQ